MKNSKSRGKQEVDVQ